MEKLYNISLNVSNKNGVFPLFRVVQGDNITRKIVAALYDENGDAYTPGTGVTAEYWSQKPDRTGTNHSATLSGSTVTITLTEQDTAAVGDVYATVKLIKDDEVLSAIPFRFKVEAFPLGANIESTSDYQTMVEATEAATQATSDAIEATEAAEQATEYATDAADTASNYNINLLAEGYDATAIYVNGDYCIYQGALYRCLTDILTPEAWTAAHWVAVELGADVEDAQRDATEGYSDTLTAGDLTSDEYAEDTEPYLFRRTFNGANNHEMDTLVGGTVAWNQLFREMHDTYTQSGVQLTKTDSWTGILNGTADANATMQLNDMLIPIIANHVNFVTAGFSSLPSKSSLTASGIPLTGRLEGMFVWNATTSIYIRVDFKSGDVFNNLKITPQFCDLTAMFGSTIADAVYAMEQAESGSGVAWFRKYFPEDYYAYDAGTLKSVEAVAHRMTGKNLFDGTLSNGYYNDVNFTLTDTSSTTYRSFMVRVKAGTYTVSFGAACNLIRKIANGVISTNPATNVTQYTFTVESDGYIGLSFRNNANTAWDANTTIQLEHGSTATTFVPYKQHTYKLSPLTLRGITKLVDGKLVYDGDTYAPSGQVVRRYGMVNLATATLNRRSTQTSGLYRCAVKMTSNYIKLNSLKIVCNCLKTVRAVETYSDGQRVEYSISSDANDGQYINFFATDLQTVEAWQAFFASHNAYVVYELATPTTETASPYEPTQVVYADGTEEYISNSIVPVGHSTRYPVSIKQALVDIAKAPSANGTYVLKCVVTDGVASYSWVTE